MTHCYWKLILKNHVTKTLCRLVVLFIILYKLLILLKESHLLCERWSSSLAMATRDNSIRKLADSMQVLADTVNSANPHLKVSVVAQCCRLHYSFLFYFGAAIGFTDLELLMKVWTIEYFDYYDLQYIYYNPFISIIFPFAHCLPLIKGG